MRRSRAVGPSQAKSLPWSDHWRRRAFLEKQVATTAGLFLEAQHALSQFRSREGVYSSQMQLAEEQSALNGLDVRRAELAADRDVFQRLIGQLDQSSGGAVVAAEIRDAPIPRCYHSAYNKEKGNYHLSRT